MSMRVNITWVAAVVMSSLCLSSGQAVAEITWISQDFEGGGTPYTLTQRGGSPGASVLSGVGAGVTNYLRLINRSNGQRNEIAFDQTEEFDAYVSLTLEFYFRMEGDADGWSVMLIPSSTYGTNGPGADVAIAEFPTVADTFGISYIIKNSDVTGLYWDTVNLTNTNLRATSPTVDLDSDQWHHSKIELVDPGPDNDVEVTYTLTSDIYGTPGTPLVVCSNYTVAGMSALYSCRVECTGRTGSYNHRTDLDNVHGTAVPPPPKGTVFVIQ